MFLIQVASPERAVSGKSEKGFNDQSEKQKLGTTLTEFNDRVMHSSSKIVL